MEDIRMDYIKYMRLKTEFVRDLARELDFYIFNHFRYDIYLSNRSIKFSGFDNDVAFVNIEYDYRESGWKKPERFIFKRVITQDELINYKEYDLVSVVRIDLIHELDKFIKMKEDELKIRINSYYGMYIDTDTVEKRRRLVPGVEPFTFAPEPIEEDIASLYPISKPYSFEFEVKDKGLGEAFRKEFMGMWSDTRSDYDRLGEKFRKESWDMWCGTRSDYDRLIEGNIKEVIYNANATIVLWRDGTKTVVKRQKGDRHDPEKAFAMCIIKKLAGNTGSYYDIFKQHVPAKYVERKK